VQQGEGRSKLKLKSDAASLARIRGVVLSLLQILRRSKDASKAAERAQEQLSHQPDEDFF
jgi:hypothetical protein